MSNSIQLARYEKRRDHAGAVTGILIALELTDGDGNRFTQEHWLSAEEMVSVLKNEKALTPIIAAAAAEGFITLEHEIELRPQPTIFEDVTTKADLLPTDKEVQSKLINLKSSPPKAVRQSHTIIVESK